MFRFRVTAEQQDHMRWLRLFLFGPSRLLSLARPLPTLLLGLLAVDGIKALPQLIQTARVGGGTRRNGHRHLGCMLLLLLAEGPPTCRRNRRSDAAAT